MCLLSIGTLQPCNDGYPQVHRLNNGDQTFGNSIATHDTTEDVDKDGSDLGVRGDELESLLDGLGGGTSTNVQEVSRRTTVQLDDIHGSHGKTSTVDKAANVTVELDEVKPGSSCLDLIGVLLGNVPPVENLLLAEVGVVVEVQLRIHGKDTVVGGLRERVDLDLSGILLHEDLIQLLDGILGLLDALLREAELGRNVARDIISDTLVDVDVGGDDGLGLLLSHGLNVHATLRRRDDDGALRGAVHEDGEVEFSAGELALYDVDGVAEPAGGSGLLGDELVADHLVGEDRRFTGSVRSYQRNSPSLRT